MSLFHHSNGLFPSYFNQNLQPRSGSGIGETAANPPCYHNDSPHLWPSPSPPNFQQQVTNNHQSSQQQHPSSIGSNSHQFPYTQLTTTSASTVGYSIDRSPVSNGGYNLGGDCSRDLDYTVSSTGGSPLSQYESTNMTPSSNNDTSEHWPQQTFTSSSSIISGESRKKTVVEHKGEISYR